MPCVKAEVSRRDVFLNPNDQMRRNLYLNTLLKIYQTLLLPNIGITKAIEDCFQERNFIFNENGRYTSKKKHRYHGQVQLGMTILNLTKCYVCLYASYDGSCEIITVDLDYDFTKTMLMKIIQYFSEMLRILCDHKIDG
ncbi:unnamed protein product [Callosobruchus maculatus]|uniref:Uncharacterized protein n=1 Tax=Callosobruchus maculatus TaxID=64391 RepID=A0A653DQ71_CALMS|nr:unnamed protein product [Callosobruchus maculatus]